MATLQALARADVERICSGQSVVDLAACVKELVENALDAGASQIDVRLREFGRDAIEVSDNGGGVAAANHASLALKHYTSKISAFEDIAGVSSFGFRGEALSSICQLASSFTVCTRTADEELGTLLMYDRSGALVGQTKKARPVGTTVVVEDLFSPLPVRLKDFHRNIKKHYTKLLKVLQAYAVSCVRVKISVSNATGKNASSRVVLATQAHQSMGDNIASVFGTKFFRTLKAVDFDLNETWPQAQDRPTITHKTRDRRHIFDRAGASDVRDGSEADDEDMEEQEDEREDDPTLSQHSATLQRRVVGFVSKVGEGVGRSDNDRQFFFINNRPFDLPKFSKAVNDVWRQFEMKQKPACVLNLLLPCGEYDVNVTPDKRETFLKNEAYIIESVKTQLTRLYEPSRGTFLVQPLLSAFAKRTEKGDKAIASTKAIDEQPASHSDDVDKAVLSVNSTSTQRVGGLTITFESMPAAEDLETVIPLILDEDLAAQAQSSCCTEDHHDAVEPASEPVDVQEAKADGPVSPSSCGTPSKAPRYFRYSTASSTPPKEKVDCPVPKRQKSSSDEKRGNEDVICISTPQSQTSTAKRVDALVGEWSFAEMKRQREIFFKQELKIEQRRVQTGTRRLSVSGASHADALEPDNDLAAAALQRVLKKDDFRQMAVVGQFNLGFIIGKLDDDDLFIIDQHASDEKYNYETLQQTTVLHQQPLVRPLPLELTAGEEMVILDNLEVFSRHGFTFLVRKDAPPTKKLQLLSLPFSKQTQFGVDDIRELASLLMDTPLNPEKVRLPKLMAMFASRACRSSIMIGTALHKEEMQRVVRNLARLEQPWNCPHGRPTLRHLLDLTQLEDAGV